MGWVAPSGFLHSYGKTPLHYEAATNDHHIGEEQTSCSRGNNMWLSNLSDLDAVDAEGKTALGYVDAEIEGHVHEIDASDVAFYW